MRRLVALLVVLVLTGGVCAPVMVAAPASHGCCAGKDGACPALARDMSCCRAAPGVPEPVAGSSASTAQRLAGTDVPDAWVVTPLAALVATTASRTADTHGCCSVPPLLRSCLRRI